MISLIDFKSTPDIFLTVSLIILLLFYEFGDDKAKKQFLPFIVVMIIVFCAIAFLNIYSQIK
jgi:hypothetical protein